MDLTDILRKRTEEDLAVAIVRSLELSLEIEIVAKKLKKLREASPKVPGTALVDTAAGGDSDSRWATITHKQSVALDGDARQKQKKSLCRGILHKFAHRQTRQACFHWHFDEIAGAFPARDKTGVNAVITSTSVPAITMSGWVVPIGDQPAFNMVEIALIGRQGSVAQTTQTYQRPDVAAHFGNSAVSLCGFRLEIPMFEIPVGQYSVRITCRTFEGSATSATAGTVTIS